MKPSSFTPRSFIETVLLLLLLLALLFALYDVLKVFFGVFTFALIFSVSFFRLFEKLVTLLKGRRILAGIIYSIVLVGVMALPFIYMISTLRHHVNEMSQLVSEIRTGGLPNLPTWITDIPYAGEEILNFWKELQHNPKEMIGHHGMQIKTALQHLLTGGAGMLGAIFEFLAGIIISAIFLVSGRKILYPVDAAVKHLLGAKDGPALTDATAKAVKGVAIGVMGTAFIAALISWIGFIIADIPFALILTALVFFLVVIQVGPMLVWIPLIIWMAMQGHTGWTIFLIVYALIVMIIDSVLKPILIAKSGKLPFLVLFLGVVGGMVAWGFTGMFKGAIILAVFYTIFNSWLEKTKRQEDELIINNA